MSPRFAGVLGTVAVAGFCTGAHGQCESEWRAVDSWAEGPPRAVQVASVEVGGEANLYVTTHLYGAFVYEGGTWASLGPSNNTVADFAATDLGEGPVLIAVGSTRNSETRVWRRTGTGWAVIGSNFFVPGSPGYQIPSRWHYTWPSIRELRAVVTYDAGDGERLYVGGTRNGEHRTRLYRHEGSAGEWTPISGYLDHHGASLNPEVRSLAAFDDGSGEAIYVAGSFSRAGDVDAASVARWSGSGWEALGAGFESYPGPLRVIDVGDGASLYAGSKRWDGAAWVETAPGMGMEHVFAYDRGDGPALYGLSNEGLWRLEEDAWTQVAPGFSGGIYFSSQVLGVAVHDIGDGPEVFVTGVFTHAGDVEAPGFVRWSCAVEPCIADWDGNGTLDVFDVLAFLEAFESGDPAADLTGSGALDVFDVLEFLALFEEGCP